jgi:hypothetical protein
VSFKGTINLSDAERLRYDADESWFNAVHASCRSHRHSVSGSLTKHCGKCFAMRPMSPSQLERIRAATTPPNELMGGGYVPTAGTRSNEPLTEATRRCNPRLAARSGVSECSCDQPRENLVEVLNASVVQEDANG